MKWIIAISLAVACCGCTTELPPEKKPVTRGELDKDLQVVKDDLEIKEEANLTRDTQLKERMDRGEDFMQALGFDKDVRKPVGDNDTVRQQVAAAIKTSLEKQGTAVLVPAPTDRPIPVPDEEFEDEESLESMSEIAPNSPYRISSIPQEIDGGTAEVYYIFDAAERRHPRDKEKRPTWRWVIGTNDQGYPTHSLQGRRDRHTIFYHPTRQIRSGIEWVDVGVEWDRTKKRMILTDWDKGKRGKGRKTFLTHPLPRPEGLTLEMLPQYTPPPDSMLVPITPRCPLPGEIEPGPRLLPMPTGLLSVFEDYEVACGPIAPWSRLHHYDSGGRIRQETVYTPSRDDSRVQYRLGYGPR